MKQKQTPPHQFNLYKFEDTRPKLKVPISAARIREVEAAMKRGDGKTALENMRALREGLENFSRNMFRK